MVKKLIQRMFGKKRKRILVFEEDPNARQLMDVHLDNLGYEAVAADSPAAVERHLRNAPSFDMLMFSIGKSKRSAVLLARDLRKRQDLRKLPILFTNVDFAPSELALVTESIANSSALTRPFTVTQLRERMQTLTSPASEKNDMTAEEKEGEKV